MAMGTSYFRTQMDSPGLMAVLGSAVLEWVLIVMLFAHALFGYLVTEFARFCDLQIPCLLCSRLDHVLGDHKHGFHKDLICDSHKLEISSLVFCNIHNKLVDVHGICEECLLSFATEKKSNSETCRLLVGKLGFEHESRVYQDPLPEDDVLDSVNERHCTCCNKSWSSRLYTRILQSKALEPEITEVDDTLTSLVVSRHFDSHDGLIKRTEDPSRLMTSSGVGNHGLDPLSRIGYTELQITSDGESEVQLSDDDDVGSPLVCEMDEPKEEHVFQGNLPEPQPKNPEHMVESRTSNLEEMAESQTSNILPDDVAPERLIHQDSVPESSIIFPNMQVVADKSHDEISLASAIAVGHGLEELNWHEEQKHNPSQPPELISLHDFPSSAKVEEALNEVAGETLEVDGAGEIDKHCKSETGLTSTAEPGLKKDLVLNVNIPPMPNLMDLSDAYKLAIGNRSPIPSSMFGELTGKSSLRDKDDLKLLISQISATRGLELPLNEMSPRIYGLGEELKISDASSSFGLHILQKRISLERNESGLSMDGSIVSEIEGESVIDRLKRQAEYDRKSMNALYKDLEEERNASAVAANQAMAMITRLQEEKATLHMEALQYLRMMEEQSEYDVDALQRANELLVDRERKIQELVAELESYKTKFQSEPTEQEMKFNLEGGDMRMEHLEVRPSEKYDYTSSDKELQDRNKCEETDTIVGNKDTDFSKGSLFDYGDERLYISQCLEKLEKKLHLFSNYGIHMDTANGVHSGKETYDPSVENSLVHGKEYHHSHEQEPTMRETDRVTLENEFSDLNVRLKALEADINFLEHIINSLRNGDEGVKFVQEIAHHLQELRRIGIRRDQVLP